MSDLHVFEKERKIYGRKTLARQLGNNGSLLEGVGEIRELEYSSPTDLVSS